MCADLEKMISKEITKKTKKSEEITEKETKQNPKEESTNDKHDRFRDWVFTDWRETEPIYIEDDMKFLAYGAETCPNTGKHHWQGYVYFRNAKSLSAVKKYFDKTTHMKVMRGSYEDNKKYCSKDGKYITHGNPPAQGQRKDLDDVKDLILNKETTCKQIRKTNPNMYHQYGRTLEKLEDDLLEDNKRTEMTKGYWLHGKTGTGKSIEAYKMAKEKGSYYVVPDDGGWWDNYKQQDTVIIDDFRGHIRYDQLLQIIDMHTYEVRRRGKAPIPFTSKTVIITSSLTPEDVYNNRNEKDSIEQLLRRVEIIEMKKEQTFLQVTKPEITEEESNNDEMSETEEYVEILTTEVKEQRRKDKKKRAKKLRKIRDQEESRWLKNYTEKELVQDLIERKDEELAFLGMIPYIGHILDNDNISQINSL